MICVCCGLCCKNVDMPLTLVDVGRLKKLGYRVDDFAVKVSGKLKLKNVDGYCFFYDKERKKCRVYRFRPEGCRIYPVVYVENYGVDVDKLCPMHHTITRREFKRKSKRLLKLIKEVYS